MIPKARYLRYRHYRELEWIFVQLADLVYETHGVATCRVIARQAHRYATLARRAVADSRPTIRS